MAGLHHALPEILSLRWTTMVKTLLNEALKLINHAIEQKLDVVYSFYPNKRHHWGRNLCSWLNGKVANLMLKKPPELYLSSFRSMSRFIVQEIIKYDLPYPYVDGLILRSTSNIGTLETTHESRTAGKSGYTIGKLIGLWLNMFTNFSVLASKSGIICRLRVRSDRYANWCIHSSTKEFSIPTYL